MQTENIASSKLAAKATNTTITEKSCLSIVYSRSAEEVRSELLATNNSMILLVSLKSR